MYPEFTDMYQWIDIIKLMINDELKDIPLKEKELQILSFHMECINSTYRYFCRDYRLKYKEKESLVSILVRKVLGIKEPLLIGNLQVPTIVEFYRNCYLLLKHGISYIDDQTTEEIKQLAFQKKQFIYKIKLKDRTLDLLMELGIMHIEDKLSGDEY